MSDGPFQRFRRFLRELKRRKVYRVAATYAVVGFVLIQVADLTFVRLGLPSWTVTLVIVLVAVGFPLALILAWAFQVTPEGVRRTPQAELEDSVEEEPKLEAGTRTGYKVLVGIGLVAAAVTGGWYLTGGGGESPEVTEGTVAVLPFEVSGSGAEEWRDGMVTYLTPGLDGVAGLRAIPDRTVFAAWEESRQPDQGASAEEALAVAREIGSQYAVVGSAGGLGSQVRFIVAVYETVSGDRLGQVEVQGPPDSVPSLADSLTRRVLGVMLKESGEALPSVDLGRITTRSLPALKSYLAGERHFRAGEYDSAVADYRAAIEEDSTFALAFARLAKSHGWQSEFGQRAKYLKQAYDLSHRLPRRERGLVRASYLRVNGAAVAAEDTLRRLSRQSPADPSAWYGLGEVLLHHGLPRGWPEAEQAFERAVELDPGFAPYHHHFVQMAFILHRDSAMAVRRIDAHPMSPRREVSRLAFDLVFSDSLQRQEAFARLDTASIPSPTSMVEWELSHPVDAGLANRVLRRLRKRDDVSDDARAFLLLWNELRQGHVRRAVALASEEPVEPFWVGCMLTSMTMRDGPVPDSIAARYLDPERLSEPVRPYALVCSGLYLLEQGREQEFNRVLDRLKAVTDTLPPEAEDVIDELRGYRAWMDGRPEQAADIWSGTAPGFFSSIRRGDLYRQLGQLERAEGWYLTEWRDPVAHQRLGQLYEEMGKPEKAAAAYRRFIAAWEDADPELQPRVEAARKRLKKLTGS